MKKQAEDSLICPCGTGKTYRQCCHPFLARHFDAPTAELLMRSRYTAFFLADEDYLRHSWHPDTCPKTIHISKTNHWLGLKIIATRAGKMDDKIGEVEFVARAKDNGKASRLHENSRFTRFNNRWVYLNDNNVNKTAKK